MKMKMKMQPILNSINNAKGVLSIHLSQIIGCWNAKDKVAMEYWLRRAEEDSTNIANGIEQLKILSKTLSNKVPSHILDKLKLTRD